jgi:cysteine desulfurase
MSEPTLCYFDHNATTRVAPEVVEAMLPFLREQWGNPSSPYALGHQARRHVDIARARAAALINAEPQELVFTSGGTESINTALYSALATQPERRHLVTTAVEHAAVLKCCAFLEKQGCALTTLPVDPDGALDLGRLEAAIRPGTGLVTVMLANNETGVRFPLREIVALCRRKGALCHTDAVQAAGRLPIDVKELGVDFLSLSGHKLRGPKGVGLLYVKRHTRFQACLLGGGQERGRRGGTENVAGIVGLGRAAELARANLSEEETRVRALRDRLERGILATIPGAARNGPEEPRLPNTTSIAFEGLEAEGLLLLLDQAGICASSGSACTSGALDPSHVLTAMGFSAARARGSIRFSLGVENTEAEVDYVLSCSPALVEKLRRAATGAQR